MQIPLIIASKTDAKINTEKVVKISDETVKINAKCIEDHRNSMKNQGQTKDFQQPEKP